MFNLQHASVLKAQPRQHISNIYIYLYVSDQSVYTGSELCGTVGKVHIYVAYILLKSNKEIVGSKLKEDIIIIILLLYVVLLVVCVLGLHFTQILSKYFIF